MARKSSFAESVINGTYGTNEKKENTQQPIQTPQTTKQPEITVNQPTKRSSFADSVINGTYGTTTAQPSLETPKTSPKINLSELKGVGEVNDKTANITNADISSKIMDYHNAFASRKEQYEAMDEALDDLAKDDGYHFGDFTKGLLDLGGDLVSGAVDIGGKVIGTAADVGGNLLHGGLQTLEYGADTLQYLGADINDLIGRSEEAEKLRQNARFNSTGALFGTNKPNETIVQQNILEELDKHSWAPEIIDDIANGVGGVGMNAALATVSGGSTLATNASIFATSYGDAMSEALNNGASVSDARLWALIDASASTLAENAFNNKFGMNTKGFAGKYLKGKFGNALDNVIKTKTGKVLFNVLKDSLEEGSEEVIETMVGNFTKSLAYNITDLLSNVNPDIKFEYGRDKVSKDMIGEFLKPLTQKETLERFIMASLTSAVYNVGTSAIKNRIGNNEQLNEQINEQPTVQTQMPQIQQEQQDNANNQPVAEQPQIEPKIAENEAIQNSINNAAEEVQQNSIANDSNAFNLGKNQQENLEKISKQEYNKSEIEKGSGGNEFRRLQEESRNLSNEEQQAYRNGSKEIDENLRGRLSRVLGERVESSRSSNSNDARVLTDNKSGNSFKVYDKVDGQTFRDVFEIARAYTKNSELVDLHPVDTNEDATGYNDTDNYITKDGLSGYAITKDGDLISVFNANDKRGWLRAIKPDIEAKAKTLDCYMSPNQPLSEMYEKIFGFKTASVMDYNMDYDHDDIAKNHNMPQVAFMVKTDQDVETKHFNKDQYDEALNYRNSFVNNEGTSDSSFSNAKNDNKAETKNEDVITIKNDNIDTKGTKTKTEDTGVSIGGKRVAIEIPTNTHKNSLGQDILNNINTEKVKKGDGDSRFYETITERSQFVNQEVKDRASQDDFIKHYDKITNQESLDNAINKLSQEGTSAISEFFTKNKQLTPDDTAMGIVLFEQAQNAGDYEMANNVLRKLRSNATTTAQVLQLYSVFSRMTPEGMYKYAGDQLLKAQEIFEKNKSKKWIEQNRDRWQLNPDEVEFIKSQMEKVQELNNSNEKMAEVSLNGYGVKDNGKTIKVTKERATQLEIAKIQKLIEDKIPAEKGQATKAWMRISMLGNPKTIATRNPLGNLLISPVNTAGDYFGSAIDKLISLKTKVRTKGGTNVPTSIKGFVEGGRESIQDKKIGVNTRDIAGNRFEIGQGKSFNENHKGLLANQRNKVSKVLNKMDRGVNFVLDLGDRPFYQAAFENSLANQMKLNNIEDVDSAPQWMLDNAQQEALERTWQDDNKYTSFVLSVRKALNNLNVKGYGIGDLLIPFAKTPANLTKAIVDYSPAGLVNAMTQGNNLRKSISNGQFTPQMQHQFVNQLGKAFAGTLLYVAAGALADAGIITGAADSDKDVADFMRYTLGIQPYSIVIGDSSFTYDWAQPVAAPFAIMADLKKKLKDSNGEADLGFIIKSAINSSSSILLEQSFLQGIQDVLGGYGDPVDNLLSEIEGLPARAIPTFFQQIATLVDGKQRMSYGNDGISNVLSQAQAKMPIWSSDLPVKRNTLGQEVERYGGENNIFNVLFNPANYSQGRATESAKEIYKIYQATNDKTILPRTVTNSIKNEDGTNLTNAQKSEFMRISGSIVDENVKELKNNKDYQKMSDVDKAAVIKKIVDYAYNKAREQVTNHTLASEYKKADQAIETGYALYDYYATKQSTKQAKTTSSNSSRNRYEEMQALGIDGETFDRFKAFVSTAKGESTTGGLTKKQKILNWINSQSLTQEQKDNLYNDYVTNSKIYSSYN